VAALDGAATLLLRVLAGRTNVISGQVTLPSSIGFVPENRRDEALIGDFSLAENFALGSIAHRRGVMDWEMVAHDTEQVLSRFDVRTTGIDASPDQLSGGNQQRFVLGRELHSDPQILVLENPTQGLDLNATSFVHERLRQSRNAGAAVVFYSSDLDELAELSDYVLVVSGAGIIRVDPNRAEIGKVLLGTRAQDAG
jgi:simple sugar transport system ATP-binding protein